MANLSVFKPKSDDTATRLKIQSPRASVVSCRLFHPRSAKERQALTVRSVRATLPADLVALALVNLGG